MSSIAEGLTGTEAARRLALYGPNEPAPVRRFSAVVQLVRLFANPLVVILLVASAIAGSPGRSCCSPKIRIETKNSVGAIVARRWRR